jgi:hypothetical protein
MCETQLLSSGVFASVRPKATYTRSFTYVRLAQSSVSAVRHGLIFLYVRSYAGVVGKSAGNTKDCCTVEIVITYIFITYNVHNLWDLGCNRLGYSQIGHHSL